MKRARDSKMQIQTTSQVCHVYMLGKPLIIQDVGKANITTVKLGIGEERNGLVIAA
tara:strand:- start:38 stop:205 length:168 start_codon:yes stop_codon:yes gene_type:complete